MVDPITALCLVALTQISGSMTAAGVAGGTIGVAMNVIASRADALLCAVTNATAGQFIRNIRDPVNHDLLKGMIAAHEKAFRHYAETLDGQATAASRSIADKIMALAKKDIPFDIAPTQALMASVTPLLAGADNKISAARRVSFTNAAVAALVGWIETETGEVLPPHFVALLTEVAPNGRESWEAKFQLHLAETIKTNIRYSSIFIASNIAELVGRTVTIEQLADGLVTSVAELRGEVGAVKADTTRILELVEAGQLGIQMRASGIDQRAFVILARKINLEVDNETQALAELSAAVEELLALKVSAVRGTNYEALVNQALQRIAEKSLRGDFDAAAEEGCRAFEEWEERQEAARQSGIALIEANIQQQVFRRDAAGAADWVMKRLELDQPQVPNKVKLLSGEIAHWQKRGCERGSNFDLVVAIELALRATKVASAKGELALILGLLGNARATLGEREADPSRLVKAIATYRAACEEWSRIRIWRGWAGTQCNLAHALRSLGEREDNIEHLRNAVTASRVALHKTDQSLEPFYWASTQNTLGTCLYSLGSRVQDTKCLKESIKAFLAALTKFTKDGHRLDWAMTQMNLGASYSVIGLRSNNTTAMKKAETAFRAALTEYCRHESPLDWANVQNNLGSILTVLDEREGGIARLAEAITSLDEALAEFKSDIVPLDFAGAMANKGKALLLLSDRTNDHVVLACAEDALRQAHAVVVDGSHVQVLGVVNTQLTRAADIRRRLSNVSG